MAVEDALALPPPLAQASAAAEAVAVAICGGRGSGACGKGDQVHRRRACGGDAVRNRCGTVTAAMPEQLRDGGWLG